MMLSLLLSLPLTLFPFFLLDFGQDDGESSSRRQYV